MLTRWGKRKSEKELGEILSKKAHLVGDISNYYGGLCVAEHKQKFYWGIEDYDSIRMVEIPSYLYESLMKYRKEEICGVK